MVRAFLVRTCLLVVRSSFKEGLLECAPYALCEDRAEMHLLGRQAWELTAHSMLRVL